MALSRHCARSWADCVAPAIPLARAGYPLTPGGAAFAWPPIAGKPHPMMRPPATPAARAIFTRDGHLPLREGDLLIQAEYARTLERLARHGLERTPASYWPYPLVHAICIDPATGKLDGGADPRGEGMALAV